MDTDNTYQLTMVWDYVQLKVDVYSGPEHVWITKNVYMESGGGAKWASDNLNNEVPKEFALLGNRPNPFNPSTEIRFDIPTATFVSLRVYDVMGREVAALVDRQVDAGSHRATWIASGQPSGLYLYRLVAGDFVDTRRMVLLK